MAPLIDVIVPVYNARPYLAPLLETFTRQGEFSSFRLLFVNDGSTDGSGEELARLSAGAPFEIRVFSQPNAGVSAARNRGLAEAGAPYIAFMDADDRVTPDYIRTLLETAQDGQADVLLFGQQRTDGKTPLPPAGGSPAAPADKTELLRSFTADPTRYGAVNLLLKRDFAEEKKLRFAEGYPYYEDYHFILSALAQAKALRFTPAPLYDYVRREGSAMARFSAERLRCLELLTSLTPLLERETPDFAADYKKDFTARIYWSVLWQACLAAPDKRAFFDFAGKTGAAFYLSKLTGHSDKTVALSSRAYLKFPAVYYTVMLSLGRRRSAVQRTERAQWDRLTGASIPSPNRILLYGMSHVRGGIESYLRDFVNGAPADSFDFLCDYPDIAYRAEMEAKGCRVHLIPPKGRNPVGHLLETRRVLKTHPEYRTVYFNLLDAGGAFTALVPFLMRRRVAVHSHSSKAEKPRLHRLLKPLLNREAKVCAACSKPAAAHMFTKKNQGRTLFVPNRVDAAKFRFDPLLRKQTRAALGLAADDICVMHVGRLSAAKNPRFLISLAKALHEATPRCTLFSAGSGDMDDEFDRTVQELGAEAAVRRLGARDDIPALLQAADAFVLPSVFEGFPIVLAEAQAAGLPCFVSDRITPEVRITENFTFLPIDNGVAPWVEAMLGKPLPARRDGCREIRAAGFDLNAPSPAVEALLSALC